MRCLRYLDASSASGARDGAIYVDAAGVLGLARNRSKGVWVPNQRHVVSSDTAAREQAARVQRRAALLQLVLRHTRVVRSTDQGDDEVTVRLGKRQ
jgi:hypothetical protein